MLKDQGLTVQIDSRRWWVVAALALGSLIMNVDSTVLNLALPTLSSALHASTAQLQWFVAGYTLAMAGLMLPAGMLGDRFGRKRSILLGLVVFGLASLACAYAVSSGMFMAARVVAGASAAVFTPLGLAVLTVLFDEGERPKAIAIIMIMAMLAAPVAPILGGWLLSRFWWGSVFLINVPVVVLAVALMATLMPESRSGERGPLDVAGTLSSSAALVALVYGIIEAGQKGWDSTGTIVPMALGVVILFLFVVVERRVGQVGRHAPLVDFRLFRSAQFTWGTVLLTVTTFALFGVSFIVPQFFRAVKGLDPMATGMRLVAMAGGLIVGGLVGPRVLERIGAKLTVAIAFVVIAAGLFMGSATTVSSGDGFLLTWMALVGFAAGLIMPAANAAALSALPRERAGSGAALMMAVRMVGGAFGVAILGSILNATYRSGLVTTGLSPVAASAVRSSVFGGLAVAHQLDSASLVRSVTGAFAGSMDSVLVVCGVIAAVAAVLSLLFLPGEGSRVKDGGRTTSLVD